jgi:hypothetical protein
VILRIQTTESPGAVETEGSGVRLRAERSLRVRCAPPCGADPGDPDDPDGFGTEPITSGVADVLHAHVE